eukprot:scaffold614_cov367-Prasinococcus_capsulatus_cf.AAC.23
MLSVRLRCAGGVGSTAHGARRPRAVKVPYEEEQEPGRPLAPAAARPCWTAPVRLAPQRRFVARGPDPRGAVSGHES